MILASVNGIFIEQWCTLRLATLSNDQRKIIGADIDAFLLFIFFCCIFLSDRPCRGYLAEQEERQRRFTTVGQKKCYAKDYTVSSGFNFIFFCGNC